MFRRIHSLRTVRRALALSLLGAAALAQAADLKVGVILPLSGPVSAQGLSDAKGIQAGLKFQDTVNGHKITVIQLDDASDPSVSARTARKLIEQDHVDVLIGTGGVPGAMAIAAVARETKTPLVSFTPLNVTGEEADWAKTTTQSASTMISAVVGQMKRAGVKTVGYIGFSDSWGDLAYASLKKSADAVGIKVVADERYARSDNSVTGQALKIMAAQPDAVLGGTAGTPGALPYIALRERGYKGAIYGTHGLLGPEFVRLVGAPGQDLIVPTGPALVGDQLPDSNPSKTIIASYRKAYQEVNGEPPTDVFSAYAFDAWLVVARAAAKVPAKLEPGTPAYRAALRDAINATKDLPATEGVLSYKLGTPYGTDEHSVVLVKLDKSKWVLLP